MLHLIKNNSLNNTLLVVDFLENEYYLLFKHFSNNKYVFFDLENNKDYISPNLEIDYYRMSTLEEFHKVKNKIPSKNKLRKKSLNRLKNLKKKGFCGIYLSDINFSERKKSSKKINLANVKKYNFDTFKKKKNFDTKLKKLNFYEIDNCNS